MEIKPNNIYCGDSYELIKQIEDKSVDLIYTDIPYLIGSGGGGGGELAYRIHKEQAELGNKTSMRVLEKKLAQMKEKMNNAKDDVEYEKYRIQYNTIANKMNITSADIVDGIDYKILDEFCRVCKYIYIYIYGVPKSKYTTLCNIS